MRLKLWMMSLLLAAVAIGWACQNESKEEGPEPASTNQTPKTRSYNGPQLSEEGGGGTPPQGVGIIVNFRKFRDDCQYGMGLCPRFGSYPPQPSTAITVFIDPNTMTLRIKFDNGFPHPSDDTFELADSEALQDYASTLGYTEIDLVEGDYEPVDYPGTTTADYVDIPIATLN